MATFKRYGTSKLANALFTRELQRRLDDEGASITALTLDPGPVSTDGGLGIFPFFLKPFMWMIMKDPKKGALTQLYCATATEVSAQRDKFKGQFLNSPGVIFPASDRSRDTKLAQSLWRITKEALAAAGIDGY
jgi:NAD(P)-dependent dehydrogenase (short-subunit alcohol dehydrogenase family)